MAVDPISRKNRVKLIDIAQASGVSMTAVSLALSDKPGISQETREKVLEIARSLGYRFKPAPSVTPGKIVKTLGLLVKSSEHDEPHANLFYSGVIAGIETACRQTGVGLMFANLLVTPDNVPVGVPPLLEHGNVDGIILAGALVEAQLVRMLDARGVPVVLVDSYSPARTYTSINTDNIGGAAKAVEYLIEKGHTDIGYIGPGEHAYPSFRERREGYLNSLQRHNISRKYLLDCPVYRTDIAAAANAVKLVRQYPLITALFAVNDDIAISTMYGLIQAGYKIPDQISIVGFDDIHLSETVVPSLTTMRLNKQSMGRLAVQLLVNQAIQPESGMVTSVFQPTLVERNSVAIRPVSV